MRSSIGKHFVGLDHVRAVAAFTVFSWHFLHVNDGQLTPHEGVFSFPLNSLFAEGHTGVGIFMVLSDYLFAKITDRKEIQYFAFLYNRFLRLAPLLVAVLLVNLIIVASTAPLGATLGFMKRLVGGLILPVWPNGGWSITIEAHFYLIFPLLILAESVRRYSSLVVVAAAIATRLCVYLAFGAPALQDVAYWTIIGRIDQFILGILFFRYGSAIASRHTIGIGAIVLWVLLWQQFDLQGGFYRNDTPSLWIVLTTLEGLFYGTIIAWYDRSFVFSTSGISGMVAKIGEWSYSIYLLHFFFVSRLAAFINENIMKLTNFYIAMFFNIICFSFVTFVGFLSYNYFEKRFLNKRVVYVRDRPTREARPAPDAVLGD